MMLNSAWFCLIGSSGPLALALVWSRAMEPSFEIRVLRGIVLRRALNRLREEAILTSLLEGVKCRRVDG